ncbi:unnamed protein product [Owenia fusiformis]|uniref:G-protein coupled receptors family 1 profile domain-containing protein n=1 Tax=Owenia fusiformis TaxID=6347 RepID=A0A8S4Q1G7_OWEFU|nr:unnamed protein product [Owenia fusiformis]
MANSIASYNKTSLMYRNGQVMTRIKADIDVAMDTLSTIATTSSEGLTTVGNFTNNTDGGGGGPFILYPYMMAPKEFVVPIYGFFTPFLIILTIVTNTLVCVVLMKKNMRSPTNTLLVAMAVSDMFTGIFPMPVFLHFYAFGYFKDYVSIDWCYLYLYFSDIIPTIFHTASIWLTMGLALQRYIYVCYSIKAKQWCTIPATIKGIIVAYVLAILSQASKFGENIIDPIEVDSQRTPGEIFTGCLLQRRSWVLSIEDIYYNIYFWFRVIFIHMIPCTSLVVLNALLIHAMKNAQKRRQMLLKQNRKSESKKLKDSNCTTLMLVAVSRYVQKVVQSRHCSL